LGFPLFSGSFFIPTKERIMNIAVTTPTGHVGSAVADFLLELGENTHVKLLARRPDQLKEFIRRGAEVVVGSQDDEKYLTKATEGVDALFWATPPGYGSDDVREFQNRLGRAAATAIQTNQIPTVVNLSSIGAEHSSGVGPISGLHDVEEMLNEASCSITHLRPGFFFENLLWQLESIRVWGRISLPLSGSKSYPMLATRDIGRVAADRLVNSEWSGHHIQELHGPTDLCFNEVAETLSRAFERKIVYIKCYRQEARDSLIQNAISENAADLMIELYDAVETGKLRPSQPRSEETTTPTTLKEFAHEVILPKISQPVRSTREW
jgi:uncharacterized protein YbjT (DUF2867 family)